MPLISGRVSNIDDLRSIELGKGDWFSLEAVFIIEYPVTQPVDISSRIAELKDKVRSSLPSDIVVESIDAYATDPQLFTSWNPPFFFYRRELHVVVKGYADAPVVAVGIAIAAAIIALAASLAFQAWLSHIDYQAYLDYCKEHPEKCSRIQPPGGGKPSTDFTQFLAGAGGLLVLLIIFYVVSKSVK